MVYVPRRILTTTSLFDRGLSFLHSPVSNIRNYLHIFVLVNSQLVVVEIPGNNKVTTEFKYKNRLLLLYVMSAKACAHLKQVNQNIKPKTPNGCEECLKMGSGWVHLRLCLKCGHVGCCDSSPNKHATKHSKATRHPIIRSFQPGEDWQWCYIDSIMV